MVKSFFDPLYTWQTNTESVVHLLECIRKYSPNTRFYQASSTDMFGMSPGGATVFDEDSALNPQSPYASAKSAAHLLCHSYREVYGLRIASGILSNHESHRRPASFLSRKVVEHVRDGELSQGRLSNSHRLNGGQSQSSTRLGICAGLCRRHVPDPAASGVRNGLSGRGRRRIGANYRDYLLATGETHAVWELVDCAFTIGGFELEWNL